MDAGRAKQTQASRKGRRQGGREGSATYVRMEDFYEK